MAEPAVPVGRRQGLLALPTRRSLHAYVAAAPGATLSAACRHVGIARTTAERHLRRLERAGLVVSRRASGGRRYWSRQAGATPPVALLAALHVARGRDVAAIVLARPGATQAEVVRLCGIPRYEASRTLARLAAAGLVRRRPGPGRPRYDPLPPLQGLLRGPPQAALQASSEAAAAPWRPRM
ncbi:MAG TPA: MarR family transcriptional regulator [Candidatus Thermoplasmatota archaeon]|nr:MarR family transcriptional regulator [Candidatus Thermoplasmatota archaeon]